MTEDPVRDRIQQSTVLRAPPDRVWEALADAEQFGRWFGVALDGPFIAGKVVTGHLVPTQVDAEIAKLQAPVAGIHAEWLVEVVDPPRHLVFRWHPCAIDPAADYSAEPTTRVDFALDTVEGGTLLTIDESGFDALPSARRTQAFEAHERGWSLQARLLGKYLAA